MRSEHLMYGRALAFTAANEFGGPVIIGRFHHGRGGGLYRRRRRVLRRRICDGTQLRIQQWRFAPFRIEDFKRRKNFIFTPADAPESASFAEQRVVPTALANLSGRRFRFLSARSLATQDVQSHWGASAICWFSSSPRRPTRKRARCQDERLAARRCIRRARARRFPSNKVSAVLNPEIRRAGHTVFASRRAWQWSAPWANLVNVDVSLSDCPKCPRRRDAHPRQPRRNERQSIQKPILALGHFFHHARDLLFAEGSVLQSMFRVRFFPSQWNDGPSQGNVTQRPFQHFGGVHWTVISWRSLASTRSINGSRGKPKQASQRA